jgi:4'-phosphopantetheinyl transferase
VRRRFVAARIGLRRVLGQYLRCPAHEIRLRYGKQGKPEVDDPQRRIHFNLTHAADLALVAVSGRGPVGIDLERIVSRPHLHAIAARMFPPAVARRLEPLQGEVLLVEFLRAWTALEASAKCLGHGLFQPPPSAPERLRIEHLLPAPDFIAAVASQPTAHSRPRLRCLELAPVAG